MSEEVKHEDIQQAIQTIAASFASSVLAGVIGQIVAHTKAMSDRLAEAERRIDQLEADNTDLMTKLNQ